MAFSQIPVAVGVTAYEAVGLYKGQRKIASMGDVSTNWQVRQLVLYCVIGVFAGIVGGMLGLGGGFILGPLFLEMGVPPQVNCPLLYQHSNMKLGTHAYADILSTLM